MSTRTDALLSQQETGKMTASISPRYDRLPPGAFVNGVTKCVFRKKKPPEAA
jgi:hypothetical protein